MDEDLLKEEKKRQDRMIVILKDERDDEARKVEAILKQSNELSKQMSKMLVELREIRYLYQGAVDKLEE